MSVQSFIPEVWSARLLAHLDNTLVAKNFFNKEYEGDISQYGDTVHINQIGDITITDYIRNTDMGDPEELSTEDQTLLIDQSKSFNFQVDDVDKAQMRTDLMDKAMERAGYGLATVEDAYLFNLLATEAGNKIGAVTIDSSDAAFSVIIKMRELLTKTNTPKIGRKLALSPEFVSYILEDTRFTGTGGSYAESVLQGGYIGRTMGFEVYEVNNLPANQIVAGHDLGATFANQLTKLEAYRPEKRFADAIKGLSLYGAKVTTPEVYASAEVTFA